VTINGEFAGGGCDYTAGSNDYLNPYQEYVYNCMVYPAGCGYYKRILQWDAGPKLSCLRRRRLHAAQPASNQYQRPNNGAAQPTHELLDVLNEQ
jgi:hypothetical protein